METINNVATAASKAIWGEQNTTQGNETAGQEPISGQTGKGTANDPYDQGNSAAANPIDPATTSSTAHDSTISDINPVTSQFSTMSSNTGNTGPHDTQTASKLDPRVDASQPGGYGNTESTGGAHAGGLSGGTHTGSHTGDLIDRTRGDHGSDPTTSDTGRYDSGNRFGATTSGSDRFDNTTSGTRRYDNQNIAPSSSTTDPTNMSGHTPNVQSNPANTAAAESRPLENTDKTGVLSGRMGDASKGSDITPSNASANPGAAPASGSAPEFKQQSADKPMDAPTGHQEGAVRDKKNEAEELLKKDPNDHSGEPLKMHGGTDERKLTQAERRESKAGQEGGQEHGAGLKGTGEEWVKTSGMAADGGDFDATKPGAGREADRLMEQKGIHKSEPGTAGPPADEGAGHSGGHGGKEKVSMGDKIKNKLHIGGSKDK